MATDLDTIVSLAKRRGFVFPSSEIYGGLAGAWDYGPLGNELKYNIEQLWWRRFVSGREDMHGVSSSILMNSRVWESAGHTAGFGDPLITCADCRNSFRADEYGFDVPEDGIPAGAKCPLCNADFKSLSSPRMFNTMFSTHIGVTKDEGQVTYLRPETAQGMFVNFKNVLDSVHPKLPFGMAQVGKAFRNEIAPRDFLFRVREFWQMEIEYFVRESEWEKWFEYWRGEMVAWAGEIGISKDRVHEREVPASDRAHYSKRTIDFDYDFPFGRKELYGLAYRTDYDLQKHQKGSGIDMRFTDPETGEKFLPHVIEPTFGVDRTVLALLCEAYAEEGSGEERRVVLRLKPRLAPVKIAVFPLLRNKPELVRGAREVFQALKSDFPSTLWDDNGNIGKRYRRQDELGTPYCVTFDFESIADKAVTVRDRDTMKQERVEIGELPSYFSDKFS